MHVNPVCTVFFPATLTTLHDDTPRSSQNARIGTIQAHVLAFPDGEQRLQHHNLFTFPDQESGLTRLVTKADENPNFLC